MVFCCKENKNKRKHRQLKINLPNTQIFRKVLQKIKHNNLPCIWIQRNSSGIRKLISNGSVSPRSKSHHLNCSFLRISPIQQTVDRINCHAFDFTYYEIQRTNICLKYILIKVSVWELYFIKAQRSRTKKFTTKSMHTLKSIILCLIQIMLSKR